MFLCRNFIKTKDFRALFYTKTEESDTKLILETDTVPPIYPRDTVSKSQHVDQPLSVFYYVLSVGWFQKNTSTMYLIMFGRYLSC